MRPPVAPRHPKPIEAFGETRVDDYFWLRDKENPEVRRYLEAENEYTASVMAESAPLVEELYEEILGRIQQDDTSVPVRKDDFFYYTRTQDELPYPIYCRKTGSLEAPEEILLDLNELASGRAYLRLGNFAVSPDHRLLAYAIDDSGDEVYTLCIKDLATGQLLPDRVFNTYYGLEWANDNRSLVYVTLDDAKRPCRAWRHTLGHESDTLLLEEPDERFHLTLSKSRSRAFLFLRLNSAATSEVHLVDAADGAAMPRCFAERRHDIQYDLEHHDSRFFIRTQDGGRNYRLLETPVSDTRPAAWREVLPHRQSVTLEDVQAFENHLVILERDLGQLRFRVRRLSDGAEHWIETPETVCRVGFDSNPEFHTRTLRFHYTSLVTPPTVFDYDMETRALELKKELPVLGGYDRSRYETYRILAKASDGAEIPVSIVCRKGLARDGSNPTLLYGYGSYGVSIDPSFASDRLSLLDRGFLYAIAHIRGGGDLGQAWHDSGKMLSKKNTFTDFIAAAETLVSEGLTRPDRLAIMGRSAGGLLVGAVLNMRPDLFHAAIAGVPFVDVLNTATDPTLPLTVIEYDEWGNSNYKEYFDYIRSYSPYDNVHSARYPHLLATAGLNDPRVSYWEPAKWVAKLRTQNQSESLILLKTNMAAGHGGASGRYERIRETAFEYAFLLKVFGLSG